MTSVDVGNEVITKPTNVAKKKHDKFQTLICLFFFTFSHFFSMKSRSVIEDDWIGLVDNRWDEHKNNWESELEKLWNDDKE